MKTDKINKRAISLYQPQEGFALLLGAGNLSKGIQTALTSLRHILYSAAMNVEISQDDFETVQALFAKNQHKLVPVIRAAQEGYDINFGTCLCEHYGVNRFSEIPDEDVQNIAGRIGMLKQTECLALLVMLQTLTSLNHKTIFGARPFKRRVEEDGFRYTFRTLAAVTFCWDLERSDFK